MERSTEIVYDFMTPWSRLDSVIKACRDILVNTDHINVHARACTTATEYLLAERGRVLRTHWEVVDNPPGIKEVDEVNPSSETIMKLNGICGFYGADRVIIHLYLHMYLIQALNGGDHGELAELDGFIEKYYRA